MKIRVVSEPEIDRLRALVIEFRDHLKARSPSDEEIASVLAKVLSDPAIEFACAFSDEGRPVGYTDTRTHTSLWTPSLVAHLEDLFVTATARGQGVGLALLEFAIGRAQGRGARSLTLNTNERNESALRLYRKAGFVLQSEGIYGDGREICLERRL